MNYRPWWQPRKSHTVALFLLALSVLSTAGAQDGTLEEANRLNAQVAQYYAMGRYGEAIQLAQRALAILEKARGPDHPDTATALDNLAELYRTTGAYARPSRCSSAARDPGKPRPDHPATAALSNSLAIQGHRRHAKADRCISAHSRSSGKRAARTIRPRPRSTIRFAVLRHRCLREGRAAVSARTRDRGEGARPGPSGHRDRSTISPRCMWIPAPTPRPSHVPARTRDPREYAARTIRPPRPCSTISPCSTFIPAPTPRPSHCTSARSQSRENAWPRPSDTATTLDSLAVYTGHRCLRQGRAAAPALARDLRKPRARTIRPPRPRSTIALLHLKPVRTPRPRRCSNAARDL